MGPNPATPSETKIPRRDRNVINEIAMYFPYRSHKRIKMVNATPTIIIPMPWIDPVAKIRQEFNTAIIRRNALVEKGADRKTHLEIMRHVASPRKEDMKLMLPRVAKGNFCDQLIGSKSAY
jgi:hypothetical protein